MSCTFKNEQIAEFPIDNVVFVVDFHYKILMILLNNNNLHNLY